MPMCGVRGVFSCALKRALRSECKQCKVGRGEHAEHGPELHYIGRRKKLRYLSRLTVDEI